MLDVHPPQHTPHGWRDFFIHIATICIGLLIAVGLEQGIEALHHRHQRHELEVQLHDEAQRNLDLTLGNLARLTDRIHWLDATIVALNAAPVTANHIPLSVIPGAGKVFDVGLYDPSQAVWAVAKANGTVALLPEEEAQVYARLDHEGDELLLGGHDLTRAFGEVLTFREAFGGVNGSQSASVSPEVRDTLVHAFAALDTQTKQTINLELNEAGSCRGVLNGAKSVNEMLQYMTRESDEYIAQHPQEVQRAEEQKAPSPLLQ